MLKIDFHVHTVLSKHSLLGRLKMADGLNTPAEMVKAAAKKGLDGIAITDHNILFDSYLAKKLTAKYHIAVLPGIELKFNKKDVIIIGIKRVPKVNSLPALQEEVHRQGGILIAPHPYDPLGRGYKAFNCFDAIEVVNAFKPYGYAKLLEAAERLKKAAVCGSDAHYAHHLGWAYCLADAEPNLKSIITAVKERKVNPVYGKVPLYGHLWYYTQKYAIGKSFLKPALRHLQELP